MRRIMLALLIILVVLSSFIGCNAKDKDADAEESLPLYKEEGTVLWDDESTPKIEYYYITVTGEYDEEDLYNICKDAYIMYITPKGTKAIVYFYEPNTPKYTEGKEKGKPDRDYCVASFVVYDYEIERNK